VRTAASDAARALEDARELAEARSRRTTWESAAEAQAERVSLLASHRAATVLRAPLAEATRASGEAERARADAAAALEAAVATGWYPSSTAPESGLPDAQEVRSAASAAEAEAAVLAERRTAETELVDLERELEDAAAALERHAAAAARSAAEAEALGRELAGLEGERSRLETDAAALPVAVIEAETAEEVVKAVEEHRRATQEVAAARAEHERRRAEALDAKESWLGLRERRLGQAAAELAARLSDSEPCPVCGSADHPDPAVGADDPLALVDAERIASGESEAAAGRERTAHEAVAAASARLAAVDARGGTTDPDKAVRLREEKLVAVRSARAAETRLGLVLEQIDGVVRRREAAAAAHEEASARVIRGEEGLRSRREERDRRRAEVQTWRGGFPSVGARQADVAAKARTIAALEASLATYGAAAQASLRAAEALASALEASAFSDAAAARAALLPDADGARLEAETSTYQDEGQQLNGLFASAAVRRALEAERNGAHITRAAVEALRASESEAERRVSAADFAAQRADTASARRSALAEELALCLPELEAARSRHRTLAELARTVRGQGENERRMSLHSYVLAARLEQVATAATERLLAMSDGRFSLEHSDALAARGAASGLGLEIVDGWTGQRRDPSTLSGGETFMASLSLALGLADVVQHESGGIDIETLFVDEGFGSLDEQALEQVMDAIEGLRAGGRVVGLVSHVSELKQRIPAQIRVGKGRDGSRIESVGLVAVGP
jgi:exonuclease SbcC